MEAYEGMGFDENNYSPIPIIVVESSKRITPQPTSMPKPQDELILNRSDPTDNRGKVNRVNSFEITQDKAATLLKYPKEDPSKTWVQKFNLGRVIATKQSHADNN